MVILDGVATQFGLEDIINGELIIPEGVTEVCESFSFFEFHNDKIKLIRLPSTLKIIRQSAFSNITLRELIIPDSVVEIGERAFSQSDIGYIKLPKNLKVIPKDAFTNSYIEKIDLPDSIEVIESNAFDMCTGFKTIKLPKSLRLIKDYAFSSTSLEQIELPDGVEMIGGCAFSDCTRLRRVKLSSGLQKIDESAFHGCKSLDNVDIPDSVIYIGPHAFHDCNSLTTIKLSNNIKKIYPFCFYNTNIKSIVLLDGVEEIAQEAFKNCNKLRYVTLPNSIKTIGYLAFSWCENLREINFPNGLSHIGIQAFLECKMLTCVSIPQTVKNIDFGAFQNCSRLLSIKLNEGLECIGDYAFENCFLVKEILIPKTTQEVGVGALPFNNNNFVCTISSDTKISPQSSKRPIYLTEASDSFMCIKKKNEPNAFMIDSENIKNLGIYTMFFADRNKIQQNMKNAAINNLFSFMLEFLTTKQMKEFYEKADLKFYNKLYPIFYEQLCVPDMIDDNIKALCLLLYNLGGFEKQKDIITISKSGAEKKQTLYLAQKVCEFIIEAIKSKIINANYFYFYFLSLNSEGIKEDFTRMFLDKNNLSIMLSDSQYHNNYFARAYNEFEQIQAKNTSNKGAQRQLKITPTMITEYILAMRFNNETPENKHIADEVSKYFTSQETFDLALSIMKEKEDNNIPDSLIAKPLIEGDVFSAIDEYSKSIETTAGEILFTLTELANKQFTYEWLSKNDPKNLILGKLCSCCAHLEGVGVGIMRASIIHPNVQNLVIKDKKGTIVAKSTLYVNIEEGYGVFNNISTFKQLTDDEKEIIYIKFIKAVNDFVAVYNQEHANKPLRILTVGMNLNGLDAQIRKYNKKSSVLHRSLYYGEFAPEKTGYEGDSFSSQYIVWGDENEQQK